MNFEFDDEKSARNLQDRGFDFAYATRVFEGRTIVFRDDRTDYGEIRMVAIGDIDGALYKVVFTERGGARRIISAHRASRQERNRWRSSE